MKRKKVCLNNWIRVLKLAGEEEQEHDDVLVVFIDERLALLRALFPAVVDSRLSVYVR